MSGIVPSVGQLDTAWCTGVLALPVTLCEAARHCLVHRCPGSTSDPL